MKKKKSLTHGHSIGYIFVIKMFLTKSHRVQRTLILGKNVLKGSRLNPTPVQRFNFSYSRWLSSASKDTRIIRSSSPDLQIPNKTYIEFILEHCERHGKKHAIVSTILIYHLLHYLLLSYYKLVQICLVSENVGCQLAEQIQKQTLKLFA